MNLYEQIQHELDSKSWNYYNMKVGDVLKNTKRSRDFIARYFCEGDKKLVIDSWQRDISKTMLDRSVHAVNVFFIGIILQKIIDPSIAIISERRVSLTCTIKNIFYVSVLEIMSLKILLYFL